MDDGYLGRSVNRRTYEAESALKTSVERVMREASAKGMLRSGNTIWSFRTEALRVFEEQFKETAQFVFNLTEINGEESAKVRHPPKYAGERGARPRCSRSARVELDTAPA